ncbi:MAG: type II toxin-antitoxin system HipA family toxin, partial [Proteobacteria bacterium]|nr:type II toxin-antitoxin system HipA family toxin [Pseudomonadota bacterium]
LDDFKACAQSASMKRGRAETIVAEVQGVVARWLDYADEAQVNPAQRDKIQAALRVEFIR